MKLQILTNEIFVDFLRCKRKSYFKFIGRLGESPEIVHINKQQIKEYRTNAIKNLSEKFNNSAVIDGFHTLSMVFQKRYPIVSDITFDTDNAKILFDALVCYDINRPAYFPIIFCNHEKIVKFHKLLVAFYGIILGEEQQKIPPFGKILYSSKFITTKVNITPLVETAGKIVQEIRSFKFYDSPPPLLLNSYCSMCEYETVCKSEAVESDNLSLLKGLSHKEIEKLHKKGIFTVHQYSYTFRPRRKRFQNTKKHDQALQSLALRNKTIYITEKPHIPSSSCQVYLDIEGNPERNLYYLVGLMVCTNQQSKSYYFWADNKIEEREIWIRLLKVINKFEDVRVYHFGSFETKYIKEMIRLYGDNILSNKLEANTFNVLSAIYGHIYFPTYSNGLKDIANYLRFKWSSKNASSVQSLVWRRNWENTNDTLFKDKLIEYNREDCSALQLIVNTINQINNHNNKDNFSPVVYAENMRDLLPKFGKINFYFQELDIINNCAYFEYQRNRIYLRTSPTTKESIQRAKKIKKRKIRVNKEIYLRRLYKCPNCESNIPYKHGKLSRVVYDLKIMDTGIKKWVVKYHSNRYRCTSCNKAITPEDFQTVSAWKYGHSMIAWIIYQLIVLLNSSDSVSRQMQEMFGYSISRNSIAMLKIRASDYYMPIYHHLIEKIRKGIFVNVDETKINMTGYSGKTETGYVWAFTNHEDIVYIYTDNREGKLLRDVLNGFKGILISDFYAAYDGMECEQQKCIIHLIRDLNDDLFKNPLDDEIIRLCREFTFLLKPIIETIDRYGLKKRYLNKHKKEVKRFFNSIEKNRYTSETARGYQKRLKKYRDKLFTFLNYDGVPWNNNNAEHAIKRFAELRRVIRSSSSPNGIQRYLVLLSVIETLRLRSINPLKFLVSGSLDINNIE